jgi:predicted membrane GTPase involved in stress response
VKTKATHQEYLNKMRAHTDHGKHTLVLDKMLGEKKALLDEKEWDLTLWEAALTEA